LKAVRGAAAGGRRKERPRVAWKRARWLSACGADISTVLPTVLPHFPLQEWSS
jgi:hypothetical protein